MQLQSVRCSKLSCPFLFSRSFRANNIRIAHAHSETKGFIVLDEAQSGGSGLSQKEFQNDAINDNERVQTYIFISYRRGTKQSSIFPWKAVLPCTRIRTSKMAQAAVATENEQRRSDMPVMHFHARRTLRKGILRDILRDGLVPAPKAMK